MVKCPKCGSEAVQSRGIRGMLSNRQYQCNRCRKYFSVAGDKGAVGVEENTYQEDDRFINVITSSRRLLTKEEVIEQFKVDTSKWEVDSFEVKTSEGYRKDRQVEWHVDDGRVISGDVSDSGKMLVVPMYHIRVKFRRKTDEIRVRTAIDEMKEESLNYAPKYPKIKYPRNTDHHLYEVDLPDIHFGRLTWKEESGGDYDIQIAEQVVKSALTKLLQCSTFYPISKILLPIGNDFFNVNTKTNTTVGGTPQQEDTRWSKTFRRGRELAVWMIEACSQVAPTDVIIVNGNHDEERTFYLGDALYSWFHRDPNVTINNGASARKYYLYGKSLIGFTHGDKEKLKSLPSIMPAEVPDLWAKSDYREWHLGHLHHKYEINEENGVVIRFLRSLVEHDAWTYQSGFVKALGAGESFVWSEKKGLVAHFTAQP